MAVAYLIHQKSMRRLIATWMIPLLLLPNFLFLVPLAPVAVATQNPTSPGVPLPPGTVTTRNTWNLTQSCPTVSSPAEPLVAEANGWKATLRIPSLLFMGSPQGTYISQSFVLSNNGTFSVSDDHGNSFSLNVPVAATGASTSTTTVGNSTMAIQETRVTTGLASMADVKFTFSVYKQFCQPAGVRLEITGTENWGPSAQGVLKIAFNHPAVSFSKYRAWFGNTSGVELGIDWSDSKALSPVFNATSSSLAYRVGQSFSIDPVTVGSTTNLYFSFEDPYQGTTFRAAGRYWAFYYDGSHRGFVSSTDGLSWSSERTLTTSGSAVAMTFYVSGATVYYASGSSTGFYHNHGTLNSDGTITWSTESFRSTWYQSGFSNSSPPSIALDSSGNLWVADPTCSNTCGSGFNYFYLEVWKCTNPSSCSWVNSNTLGPWGNWFYAQVLTLTSGKMSVVYMSFQPASNWLRAETYSGSTWSTEAATSGPGGHGFLTLGSCTSLGDTTECVEDDQSADNSNYIFLSYNNNNPAWSSATALDYMGSSSGWPSISSDGSSKLVIIEPTTSTTIVYRISNNAGASWNSPVTLTTAESYIAGVQASFAASGGDLEFQVLWGCGSGSPYNIRFASVPLIIQQAALSAKPWSRPGLSPYESYFSEFFDYVSPGNGLVSVEAGTLNLAGRGIDFVPSLVYSEPYAFKSGGSPYLYDNYTGASLGYGWSLNFPWLGTNYLHLSDGQAFPYSWNVNTFQYNGVTNFVLTKNTGGTYTLNMSSGTLYRFDTSKRLISITDGTGSNVISFSYGTNNYVSQVADTINRLTTFSYNANNQLTSISEGGRTWSLGYTGNQLTTLTDPLSRVTAFQYAGPSGANAWLLSAVIWPTQGRVTYTFTSKSVGTEVSTYYTNRRNTYYDSSPLTQSQQINYTTVNGQVTWSNSTIYDGTTYRGYLYYNFQPPSNLMKVYSYDGTRTLQRITETDSDQAGRTNATKIYSPSGGTPLAQATYFYDNWGNMIYSVDNVGQKTWYAYANASPSNFGSSGCTTSFYTQSISPNIHNLIIGQCDYQNGPGTPQQQTYFKYDNNGNLLEKKVLHPSSGWLCTDYTYDSYGNVLRLKNPDGYYANSTYSSTYSSAYLTKQNSTISRSPYKFAVTTWTWNSSLGLQASVTDPRGYTTSYKYDNIGRLKLVSYGGTSYTRSYAYDDTNNIMTVTDENGHVTKQYFDGLARQTKIERWNASSVYSSETYTYNWVDAVATKTTAAGNIYTYSYDWNGQLTKLTNPDTTYETTSYDYVNNLKTVADENGHQTVYTYNWNNWLTSVKQYNSSTNYYQTTYSYDLSGNLLSVTDAKSPGQVTGYQYDNLNRLNKTTFPDTKTETRTYDSVGNLLTRMTANGSTISYSYDGLNRLTKVTYPGSGGTVTYTYDADGNRLSMLSPSANDYYSYSNDALDRMTNQTEYINGVKYQTLYTYDGVGDILSLTYPDSYALTMTYDGVNRLKKVGGFATIGYTVDDKISKITYGNGEVAAYTYDNRDRPKEILDRYGSTKKLDLNYTYDGSRNLLTINTVSYRYDYLR